MRLTPLDIRKQEFTRGFRGYDPEEVQAFLQMVSSQWDEILDESRRKDEKIRELENKMTHYEKVEEALQEALQTARETSRTALQNAEEKARLIVDQAEKRAEDIKRDAEQDRHQIKRETAKLSGRRSEIVTRLRAFLMSEMELLARYEGDDPVGFIKLLPAEERRLRQLATESGAADEHRQDPEGAHASHTEQKPGTTFAPTPVYRETEKHEQSGDQQRAHEDVRAGRRNESDYDEEEAAPAEESKPAASQRQQEEVMHGPGWTARTVISRPPEQTGSRPEHAPEDPQEEQDDETSTRASSDEIEKIRRILSDLD